MSRRKRNASETFFVAYGAVHGDTPVYLVQSSDNPAPLMLANVVDVKRHTGCSEERVRAACERARNTSERVEI